MSEDTPVVPAEEAAPEVVEVVEKPEEVTEEAVVVEETPAEEVTAE